MPHDAVFLVLHERPQLVDRHLRVELVHRRQVGLDLRVGVFAHLLRHRLEVRAERTLACHQILHLLELRPRTRTSLHRPEPLRDRQPDHLPLAVLVGEGDSRGAVGDRAEVQHLQPLVVAVLDALHRLHERRPARDGPVADVHRLVLVCAADNVVHELGKFVVRHHRLRHALKAERRLLRELCFLSVHWFLTFPCRA